jgi:hypothetical protein
MNVFCGKHVLFFPVRSDDTQSNHKASKGNLVHENEIKVFEKKSNKSLSIGKYISVSKNSQLIKFFVFLKNATEQVLSPLPI